MKELLDDFQEVNKVELTTKSILLKFYQEISPFLKKLTEKKDKTVDENIVYELQNNVSFIKEFISGDLIKDQTDLYKLNDLLEKIINRIGAIKEKEDLHKKLIHTYENYLRTVYSVKDRKVSEISNLSLLEKNFVLKEAKQLIKNYGSKVEKINRVGNRESFSTLPYSLEKLQIDGKKPPQWFIVEQKALGAGITGKVKKCFPLSQNGKGGFEMGDPHAIKIAVSIDDIDLENIKNESMHVKYIDEQQSKEVEHGFRQDPKKRMYKNGQNQTEGTKFRFTQEYVGPDLLHHFLKRNFENMSLGQKILICKWMSEKIQLFHDGGLVHRDIKLENILLSLDFSKVEIIDLNSILKQTELLEKHSPFDGSTRHYMDPHIFIPVENSEKYELRKHRVDPSQDIFALLLVFACVFQKNNPHYKDDKDFYKNNPIFKQRTSLGEDEEAVNAPAIISFSKEYKEGIEQDLAKEIEDFLIKKTEPSNKVRGSSRGLELQFEEFLNTYLSKNLPETKTILDTLKNQEFPGFPKDVFVKVYDVLVEAIIMTDGNSSKLNFEALGQKIEKTLNQFEEKKTQENKGDIIKNTISFFSNETVIQRKAVSNYLDDTLQTLKHSLEDRKEKFLMPQKI